MGPVRDIYYHQTQGGDEFVGQCASMLNMFNGDFACSPAFFDGDDIPMSDLADAAVKDNFPHHHEMDGMKQILHCCLSAMVFHRKTILQLLPILSVCAYQHTCKSCQGKALMGDHH
jgi:hypothetical protein